MESDIKDFKKYIKIGGIGGFILAILIWIFLSFLYKYSFMCFIPHFCNEIDVPTSQRP